MTAPKILPGSPLDRAGAVFAGDDLQERLRHEVASFLGRKNVRFPGAQPVSFSADHLQELKQKDYWVCEKTDGERFLLWMTNDGPNPVTYLINRTNQYFYVPGFVFPHHERKEDFHCDTILDGELVEDKYPDGHTEINFLVFDMLVIDGQNMMQRTLDKRTGYFREQVLKPFQHAGRGPFQVKGKAIEFAYALEKMFGEIIPQVKKLHGNDGLIFTCRETPYHPGTDPHILKWKPPEENTVDFLMHIVWTTSEPDPSDPDGTPIEDYDAFPVGFELWVSYGDQRGESVYKKHGDLYVTSEEWESWKRLGRPLQDIPTECFQEPIAVNGNGVHLNGNGARPGFRWRWYRFRFDKEDANHISTFESVLSSIEDRVTQEDLIREQEKIRDCWKERQKRQTVR